MSKGNTYFTLKFCHATSASLVEGAELATATKEATKSQCTWYIVPRKNNYKLLKKKKKITSVKHLLLFYHEQ